MRFGELRLLVVGHGISSSQPLLLQSHTHLSSLPRCLRCSRTNIFLPVSDLIFPHLEPSSLTCGAASLGLRSVVSETSANSWTQNLCDEFQSRHSGECLSSFLRFVTRMRSSPLLFNNARLDMTLVVFNTSALEPFSPFKSIPRVGFAAFLAGVVNSFFIPFLRLSRSWNLRN